MRPALTVAVTLALLALAYLPVFTPLGSSSLLPLYWALLGFAALALAWAATRGWGGRG